MVDILKELNGKKKKIILDTDTYNEVDDQFALAYAMASEKNVELLAVTAEPFFNQNSTSPLDGMIKSYDEILHTFELAGKPSFAPAYRGSEGYLTSKDIPRESDAADIIVKTVTESDEPIFIVATGAITNVASAIIKCPEICKNAAVIWLGGHALHWQHTKEFNMSQDLLASRVLFDSDMPLLQIPCRGVCSEFITTVPELNYYLKGKNELCDYLVGIVEEYSKVHPFGWSKVMWDVTAVGVLTVPSAFEFVEIPRPLLTDNYTYSFDMSRKSYVYTRHIRRDPIYEDMFLKLPTLKKQTKAEGL